MYFSKFAKKVLAVAVAVAVTASSVVATPSTKKADAASYKAYLCLQTAKFTFRNQHDDAKFSNKLQNTTNKLSKNSVKFKDTTSNDFVSFDGFILSWKCELVMF